MKHFYRLILALLLAVASFACATNELDEQIATNTMTTVVPEEIYAGFDDESTRVQLDALCRTTWTKGDLASAFYFSDKVSVFRFMGKTGDRTGALQCISQGTGGNSINKVVLLYPHSESYTLNASKGRIGVTIPDVQHYQEGSYGVGANLMASVGEDTKFSLKNLCGWVKVQFVGAGTVSEVTLSGNAYEQVAGDASFYYDDFRLALLGQDDAADDDSELGGSLVFGEYKTTVKLDCGDGIALDPTEPTEFYLVLAPQTFEGGITVTATLTDGTTLTKSTSKPLTVERNHIVPMSPLGLVAQREIHYTATEKIEPYDKTVFGTNYVSNVWDETTGKGVITFDGAVTTIGKNAFRDCTSLTSITIPDCVTSIGYYAFYGCSGLENANIPDSVILIDCFAFQDCSSLTSIIIPEKVTFIGTYAFQDCSSLTSVTIPNEVTTIGYAVFEGCSSLEKFEGKFASEDGKCLIVDGVLNSFAPAGITEYAIPQKVISIGEMAFRNCTSLTSITIPNSVTSIGKSAFDHCHSLVNITLPEGVTSIRLQAFSGCLSLTSITIPEGVTSIGKSAFSGCSSLASITIPEGVTSIGEYAFFGCWSLASIIIPDSVIEIGNAAFNNCVSLESITIPNGITEIRYNTFDNCNSLTNITIPEGVTSIGSQAFYSCDSLTSIIIPDSVTSIGDYAFDNCTSLTSITIPEGVTSIGESAFNTCSSLANITLPDSVTSIGKWAFMKCSSLTSITIPDSVTSIDEYAFMECSSLTSITIPDSVTEIGNFAFSSCGSLTSVTIGNNVTKIGKAAFNGCRIVSIIIPESVTSIGSAFINCFSLASVYCKPVAPPAVSSLTKNNGLKIYVPTESVEAYKTAEGWSKYADAIVGYDFE